MKEMNDQRLAKLVRDIEEMAAFLKDRRVNTSEGRVYMTMAMSNLSDAATLIAAMDAADPR